MVFQRELQIAKLSEDVAAYACYCLPMVVVGGANGFGENVKGGERDSLEGLVFTPGAA